MRKIGEIDNKIEHNRATTIRRQGAKNSDLLSQNIGKCEYSAGEDFLQKNNSEEKLLQSKSLIFSIG